MPLAALVALLPGLLSAAQQITALVAQDHAGTPPTAEQIAAAHQGTVDMLAAADAQLKVMQATQA